MLRTIFLSLLALAFLGCCDCPKPAPVKPQPEFVATPPVNEIKIEPKVEIKPEVKPEELDQNKRKDRREDRRENRTFPRL